MTSILIVLTYNIIKTLYNKILLYNLQLVTYRLINIANVLK